MSHARENLHGQGVMQTSEFMATCHPPNQNGAVIHVFPLHCPVQLTFGANGVLRQLEGFTENVSRGGILLEAPEPTPREDRARTELNVPSLALRTLQ